MLFSQCRLVGFLFLCYFQTNFSIFCFTCTCILLPVSLIRPWFIICAVKRSFLLSWMKMIFICNCTWTNSALPFSIVSFRPNLKSWTPRRTTKTNTPTPLVATQMKCDFSLLSIESSFLSDFGTKAVLREFE